MLGEMLKNVQCDFAIATFYLSFRPSCITVYEARFYIVLFLINTDAAIPQNRRGLDNAAFLSDNIFVIFHVWQDGLNIVALI